MIPRLATTPIGVDAAGRWFKAVQLRPGRRSWRTHAWARVRRAGSAGDLTPGDAAYLSGVLQRRGFDLAPLAAAAPRDAVIASPLELPPRTSGAPLSQIARLELARIGRCEPDLVTAAMWEVPRPVRGGEATHVYAVGVPAPRADALVAAFADVGLELVVLDFRDLAIVRALISRVAKGLHVVVDIGWDAATVLIVLDGVLLHTRALELAGLCRLYDVLVNRLGVVEDAVETALAGTGAPAAAPLLDAARGTMTDYMEALIPEVRRSLSFSEHRYPGLSPAAIHVTGDGAMIPGVVERLRADFGLPSDAASFPGLSDPALTAAAGLALNPLPSTSWRVAS